MEFSLVNLIAYGVIGFVQQKFNLTGAVYMLVLLGFILVDSAAGYLLGSINPAIIVSKRIFGADIRTKGSGNAGMTNMFRVFGKKAGFLTLLGDMLKTVIATLIGYFLFGNVPFLFQNGFVMFGRFGAYLAGMFCVIGHLFPLYYQFKGGKGVLVTAVMLLMTDWPVLIMSIIIFAIVLIGTKMVSLASVMSALMMPLLINIWYRVINYAADAQVEGGMSVPIAMVITVLVVVRHIDNLKRVRAGTEPKVRMPWEKKNDEPDCDLGKKGISGRKFSKKSKEDGTSLFEKDK